ncbi:MAG: hypothetical protein AAGF56_07635 [Pseudomonadota bacterium]
MEFSPFAALFSYHNSLDMTNEAEVLCHDALPQRQKGERKQYRASGTRRFHNSRSAFQALPSLQKAVGGVGAPIHVKKRCCGNGFAISNTKGHMQRTSLIQRILTHRRLAPLTACVQFIRDICLPGWALSGWVVLMHQL